MRVVGLMAQSGSCTCGQKFHTIATHLLLTSTDASISDIQELEELIYRRLSTYDLAQCARVSKTWHTNSTPYLWQDLTYPSAEALCQLILEDYLYEQQHQVVLEGEGSAEKHSSAPSTASLPSLTKYGMYVRWLSDPTDDLLRELRVIVGRHALRGHSVEEKASDLILHLLKRCPLSKVRAFALPHRFQTRSAPQMTVLEKILPRVQDLRMSCFFPDQDANFQKLRDLMDRCSGTLERLSVNAGINFNDDDTMSGIFNLEEEGRRICWTSLKELNVLLSRSTSDPTFFWTWLMKRCRYVTRMKVGEIRGSIQSVARCMRKHLPHLDEIWMSPASSGMKIDEITTLLTGSSKGWRVVKLYSLVGLEESTMKALLKHSSTLEVLCIDIGSGTSVPNNSLVQILASCPNLRCLEDAPNYGLPDYSHINANVFIDQNQDTGALRTWACESSLKELRIRIKGIPRPDATVYETEQETYPGQSRDLQGLMYDRLARLTCLEVLWIGGPPSFEMDPGGLEMSLESGLDKLSGMKQLKELNLPGMNVRIGVQEAQWMTEH